MAYVVPSGPPGSLLPEALMGELGRYRRIDAVVSMAGWPSTKLYRGSSRPRIVAFMGRSSLVRLRQSLQQGLLDAGVAPQKGEGLKTYTVQDLPPAQ